MPPQLQLLLFALLHLSVIALFGLSVGAQTVDSNVCVETSGNEFLPPYPNNSHVHMVTVTKGVLGTMIIMTNANTNRTSVTYGQNTAEEFKAVLDGVTNQILIINNKADMFDIFNCQVQNSSAAALNSLMTKISFLGSDRYIPTGNLFNGVGLKIVKDAPETINGIQTDAYRTCHYSVGLQLTLQVKWWYSQATKLPVKVALRYGMLPGNVLTDTELYPSQVRSMSDKQDATNHQFTAPKGVFCKGLNSIKSAPGTFNRFSTGFDRYIYNFPNVDYNGPDSFRESYDLRVKLTMLEGESANSPQDKVKYGMGRLVRINDYNSGISYIKNLRFENCTFEKIPANDWDNVGNRLRNPDELYFPGISQLQYKGSGVYRSADVDIYIGYQDNSLDMGDGKKYPLAAEYYLNIRIDYDGTGNPTFTSVPLGIYYVSPSKYNSPVDIFDFSTGVPRIYDHDISECFSAMQKLHFELIMGIDNLEQNYVKYLFNYRDEFTYALVKSLSIALNISALRIIQPTVLIFADPLFMVVEITISEKATVPGYTPSIPEIALSQVTSTMSNLISKGTLIVDITEGDLIFQVPVKDYKNMDARSSAGQSGMPSGAVAGLSVGMLILGIAIGIGIFFAVGYFRKDASQFGFNSFQGPASES